MLKSLKKGTEHMREQRTKVQVKKKKKQQKLQDNTHLLLCLPNLVINQPLPTYPIPPSFIITIQWT